MLRFDDRYLDILTDNLETASHGRLHSGLVALGCMINNKPVTIPIFFKKSINSSGSGTVLRSLQGGSGPDKAIDTLS